MVTVLVLVLIALVVLAAVSMLGGAGPTRVVRRRTIVERPAPRRVVEERVVADPYADEVVERPVARERRVRRVID